MEATRIERDALGELPVPATALFGIHTVRAMRHLSFSPRPLGSYPGYVRALGQVKRAAARTNGAVGTLDSTLAAAIDAATQALIDATLPEQFPVDVLGGGGAIGVHMNVNEVVANLANERLGSRRGTYTPIHPKRHVGASQSTADVCHTALRLAIIGEWHRLEHVLATVITTLAAKASEWAQLPTLARTCLQDAMPTNLGMLFGGYRDRLTRRAAETARCVGDLHAVVLGATVIGSGEGASPAYRQRIVPVLAEVTATALRQRDDLPCAMQSSDDIRSVSTQCARLAEAMITMGQDLRLLASGPQGGFGEILLPHVIEGSSFFGNKRNPVLPETIMQCAFQVLGCDRSAQAASEHGELYLNVFDGLAAINVIDAMSMLSNALASFEADCLRGLTANEERCSELAALGAAASSA